MLSTPLAQAGRLGAAPAGGLPSPANMLASGAQDAPETPEPRSSGRRGEKAALLGGKK